MEIIEKRKEKKPNKESVKEYQKNRDAIMLRQSKEEGQKIRDTANAAGQSVQKYILQAVKERIEREQGKE